MTRSPDPGQGGAADAAPPSVVRSEERLHIGHEWVAVERVRIRRRIVSEEVLVPVTVRREELVIEQMPIEPLQALAAGEAPAYRNPVVLTLHEEVPVVSLARRPYERVIARVRTVRSRQEITTELAREEIAIETDAPAGDS